MARFRRRLISSAGALKVVEVVSLSVPAVMLCRCDVLVVVVVFVSLLPGIVKALVDVEIIARQKATSTDAILEITNV